MKLPPVTLAHHVPALHAPDLEAALEILRRRGLRVSASRRLVLEALYADRRPRTAEQIANGTDVASVYRNLDTLEELGLVRHVHLGHGPGLYSLDEYEFVTCDGCGAYEAIDPQRLDEARAAIQRAIGYHARFNHFPIVGLCEYCHAHS